MAKFYLQSGTLRTVIDSPDASRAALWAIHQAMQQIAPLDGETPVAPNRDSQPLVEKNFIVLGDTIAVSEIGFDREDAVKLETFEAFHEWYCLAKAMDRLEKQLSRLDEGQSI